MQKIITGFLLLVAAVTPALAGDTTIQIPVGDWVVGIAGFLRDILVPALMGMLVWVARIVSPALGTWMASQRTAAVEQLLQRAVDYGINAVAGAAKGQQLTVPVGSEVLAHALGYAIQQGPTKLVTWVGGADALRDMILARMNLETEASAKALGLRPPLGG